MKKGICLLPWIPIRSAPNSASEMVSSLIFGETYEVLEEQENWLSISTNFDSYKGFISVDQFGEFIDSIHSTWNFILTKPFLQIEQNGFLAFLPGGAFLPNLSSTDNIRQFSKIENPERAIEACRIACSFIGTPYLWGGRCYAGIDCSGLVQITYKILGISLPRDSNQQALFCESIALEKIIPGDLLFLGKNKEKITHVAIYLGENKVVHASGSVKINEFDGTYIVNENKKITHQFISAGRVPN